MPARGFVCPSCAESRVLPSRMRGVADLPLRLLLLRPWRCLRCYRRMWRPLWWAPCDPDRGRVEELVELRVALDP